jgi:DNA-binding transcriptional regulator YhcF (GntR family)
MDLSFLIPSKIRRQVLAYFVENPDAQICIRELARELRSSPQMIHRELVNLEEWGFLFSSKQANQRVFRVNEQFPFYPSIKDLFQKYQKEVNREYSIDKTYNLNKMVKRLKRIPISKELISGLTAKRKKHRAWVEEKVLEKLEKNDRDYLTRFAKKEVTSRPFKR